MIRETFVVEALFPLLLEWQAAERCGRVHGSVNASDHYPISFMLTKPCPKPIPSDRNIWRLSCSQV
jgi:hypothetical protein